MLTLKLSTVIVWSQLHHQANSQQCKLKCGKTFALPLPWVRFEVVRSTSKMSLSTTNNHCSCAHSSDVPSSTTQLSRVSIVMNSLSSTSCIIWEMFSLKTFTWDCVPGVFDQCIHLSGISGLVQDFIWATTFCVLLDKRTTQLWPFQQNKGKVEQAIYHQCLWCSKP